MYRLIDGQNFPSVFIAVKVKLDDIREPVFADGDNLADGRVLGGILKETLHKFILILIKDILIILLINRTIWNLICHYRFFLFSTGHNLTHSSILTAEMGLNCLCPFDHYKTTAENPSFIFRPWQENITLHHPPTKLISPKTTISSKLGTPSYSKQQKIK